jgi:hypothetical protein
MEREQRRRGRKSLLFLKNDKKSGEGRPKKVFSPRVHLHHEFSYQLIVGSS